MLLSLIFLFVSIFCPLWDQISVIYLFNDYFLRFKHHDQDPPLEELFGLMASERVVNRGALHAAIACFGDRRVCAALRQYRQYIGPRDARDLASAFVVPTTLNRATIEYFVSWLIDLSSSSQEQLVPYVSQALSEMLIRTPTKSVVYEHAFHFGPYCFATYTSPVAVTYEEFVRELQPLLEQMNKIGHPSLIALVEILQDPNSMTREELERRSQATRRRHSERRASDRRIVNLAPLMERRRSHRRNVERRVEVRRQRYTGAQL